LIKCRGKTSEADKEFENTAKNVFFFEREIETIKPELIVAVDCNDKRVHEFLEENLLQEYGGKLYCKPIRHYSKINRQGEKKEIKIKRSLKRA
jgi:hypothetical protein